MPPKLRVPLAPLAPLASVASVASAAPAVRGDVVLDEATSRYVARVHRLGVGADLVLFDPEACTEADAVIAEITTGGRRVRCVVSDARPGTALTTSAVTLVQALGKGDKPEQVVRDATALGVARIVFAETARGVVVVGDRGAAKQRRFRAVAVEAARQCGRGDLPLLDPPLAFTEALAAVRDVECRLCLDPRAETTLGARLRGRPAGASLALLVGPEGGFDESELGAARAAGFTAVSLGGLVLRTETAAVAALGAILAFASER